MEDFLVARNKYGRVRRGGFVKAYKLKKMNKENSLFIEGWEIKRAAVTYETINFET